MTDKKQDKVNLSFWLTPEEVKEFDEVIKVAKIKSRSAALQILIEAVNAGTIKLTGAVVGAGGEK